ncbi:hypothetical protein IWQ62_004175 [Dispira parvispora]|uniref:Uncharacterized protein n=1 Tax=Dispira parvispora TaxID=1520584 RepID=A0A9W8ATE1_9FUNG|nr:hypothetical protein IWQ62_004175 [Dispira parvispora]
MGCCPSRPNVDSDEDVSPLLQDGDVPNYTQDGSGLRSHSSSDTLSRQVMEDEEYQRQLLDRCEHDLLQATRYYKYHFKSAEDIDYQATIYQELINRCDAEEDSGVKREHIDLADHMVRTRADSDTVTPRLSGGYPTTKSSGGGGNGLVPAFGRTTATPGSGSTTGAGSPARRAKLARRISQNSAVSLDVVEVLGNAGILDENVQLINDVTDQLLTALQSVKVEYVGDLVKPLTWRSSP